MNAPLANVHDAREIQVAHSFHVLADRFERGVGESKIGHYHIWISSVEGTHLMHVQRSREVRRVSEGAMDTMPWSVMA
jgi:hypothetical protein